MSSSSAAARAPSPTPSEREKLDAADRAREAEEQAQLPYKWTQTLTTLEVTIPIPGNLKSRDLIVELKKNHLKVAIKNQSPPLIDGPTPHALVVDDSTWTLDTTKAGKDICIHIQKATGTNWWAHVVTNAPAIDVTKITPEPSKLSDLDGETRGMVEKMMFDQEMKRQGKPDSEERKKEDILKKFMSDHPEMDFSKAKMT